MKMNKKRMSNRRFMAILIPIMAIVLVTLMICNLLALNYRGLISTFFNHTTYKIVETGGAVGDSTYYPSDFETEEELTEHSGQVAELLEAEGMVLLENDGGLPLARDSRVSLFSVSSVSMVYGGTGSGSVDTSTVPDLKTALEASGLTVNPTLWDFYQQKSAEGYTRSAPNWRGGQFAINEVPWTDVASAAGSSFADYGDAAIVVISRSGGEGSDLTAVNFAETEGVAGNSGNYLELSAEEADMLAAVNEQFDNVVVLINANNALELGWLADYENIKAALWIGGVGQTGLYAVADALVGDVVPSGRLVDTYAYDASSAPAAQNAGSNFWINNGFSNESDQYIVYAEGIYVGYRYYETRYEDVVMGTGNAGDYDYASTVLYPFGYGLSYTQFAYSDFSMEENGDSFTVTVTVTNTGDTYTGKEVVQVYFQSPYTQYDIENGVEKASVELCGFAKTDALAPGESQTVQIDVPKEQLKAYDYRTAKTFILDAGDYYFTVGTDAHDAMNNILAAKGYTVADGMTADGDASMTAKWTNASLDATTYAVDSVTGTAVTNLFGYADISSYDAYSDFVYLSRNNWADTFPAPFCDTTDEATGERYIDLPQEMIDALQPQYTEDQDSYTMPASGVTPEVQLTLADFIDVDYDDPAWDDLLDTISPADLIYMVRMGGYGTPSLDYILKPATVEKDGPAGISATLVGGTQGMAYPTEVVIASTWNTQLAYDMGVSVGNDAMYANIQGWYAPAMNIHRSAYSGRNFEYYSEDGFISGQMGANTVLGAQSKGLFCYVKHFAFNDTEGVIDESNGIKGSKDGIATFFNEQAARELYLVPFEAAVKEGHTYAMMNAFNRVGTKWCGASHELLTDLLREEWGFNGLVITDMAGLPEYMDIKAGLQAGTDMWMNTSEELYNIDGYQNDPQIMTYLRSAAHDICYTVSHSAAMNGLSANSTIVDVMPLWMTWMVALDVVVGVLIVAGVVWIVVRNRDQKKNPDKYRQ